MRDTPSAIGTLVHQFLLGPSAPCYEGLYTGYNGIHLVGRSLSTLADLATLLGLAALARALYGKKVALLAAVLYAFAALPIQHAHFFVVDSFATVFVVWTLYFAMYGRAAAASLVVVARRHHHGAGCRIEDQRISCRGRCRAGDGAAPRRTTMVKRRTIVLCFPLPPS